MFLVCRLRTAKKCKMQNGHRFSSTVIEFQDLTMSFRHWRRRSSLWLFRSRVGPTISESNVGATLGRWCRLQDPGWNQGTVGAALRRFILHVPLDERISGFGLAEDWLIDSSVFSVKNRIYTCHIRLWADCAVSWLDLRTELPHGSVWKKLFGCSDFVEQDGLRWCQDSFDCWPFVGTNHRRRVRSHPSPW